MKVLGALCLVLLVASVSVSGHRQDEAGSLFKKTTDWDAVIDQLISEGGGAIDRACIFSSVGGSLLSSSDHPNALDMTTAERLAIAVAYRDNDWDTIGTQGLYVDGQKYIFLGKDQAGVIKGLKIGGGRVLAERSDTAIVVVHTSSSSFYNANVALGRVVSDLESRML